jgi:hypothetical protein
MASWRHLMRTRLSRGAEAPTKQDWHAAWGLVFAIDAMTSGDHMRLGHRRRPQRLASYSMNYGYQMVHQGDFDARYPINA